MPQELSNIEQELERSIYHAIRLVLVEYGYLPDILQFDISNSNSTIALAAQEAYQDAIAIIKNDKGYAIEVFNYNTSQGHGTLKVPRIVIETQAFLPGQLGADTSPQYVKQEDKSFKKLTGASTTSDFYYNIRLIANSVKQIRTLHGIMIQAIPRRGYIKWYSDEELRPNHNLLTRYISHNEENYLQEGIIEKVFRYEIPDAYEKDLKEIGDTPNISDIDFKVNNN